MGDYAIDVLCGLKSTWYLDSGPCNFLQDRRTDLKRKGFSGLPCQRLDVVGKRDRNVGRY